MVALLPSDRADHQAALQESGRRVRDFLQRSAEYTFLTGQELVYAKSLCTHGEWQDWLKTEFPLSERTAQRYMKAYQQFKGEFEKLTTVPLAILDDSELPTTLIPQTPEQETLFNNANTVVMELAPDSMKAKVQAGEIGLVKVARAITLAPPPVRECAKKWDVTDPDVLNVLTRMAETLPDEFTGVVNSGFFQWDDGRRVKLQKASYYEARECYASLRRDDAIIEHEAATPQPLVDTKATINGLSVNSSDHGLYNVSLLINEETYRKLQKIVNTEQRLIIKPLTR